MDRWDLQDNLETKDCQVQLDLLGRLDKQALKDSLVTQELEEIMEVLEVVVTQVSQVCQDLKVRGV